VSRADDALGIYVHVPFCRVRCGYCSFAITTHREREGAWRAALGTELDHFRGRLGGRPVDTIYFGGGTPSLLADDDLGRLLAALRAAFAVDADAETTLEANPDDLPEGRAAALRALGVTRLSIGVQSLDDRELALLDRTHDAAGAEAAIGDAVASGLAVSVDLMLGTPGQSSASFRRGLGRVVASGVGHVSIYVLETDKPSRISREVVEGRAEVESDDEIAESFLAAVEALAAAGLERYEVSSFASPGAESRHNLRSWRRRPYLGLGPSAASLVDGERLETFPSLPAWLRAVEATGCGTERAWRPEPDEVARERLYLGLREARGVEEAELRAAAARLGADRFLERIEDGLELGDVVRQGGRLAFTATGFLRMNGYLAELF